MPTYMPQQQQQLADPELNEIMRAQLYAKALREGAQKNIDIDGEMVGPYWVARDNRGEHLKQITAAGLDYFAGDAEKKLANTRQQREQEQLAKMPTAYQEQELSGPTPEGPSLSGTVQQPKALPRLMQEYGQWASGFDPTSAIGQAVKSKYLGQAIDEPFEAAKAERALKQTLALEQAKGKKPMVERDFPVGEAMVQPHISYDDGVTWQPIPGSARTPKFAKQVAPVINTGGPRDRYVIRQNKDGTDVRVNLDTLEETPLSTGGPKATKALPVGAQRVQSSLQNLESGLAAYEKLLADYDPQSKDIVTDAKRAAIESAFTDLQMRQKEAYELGAITGPDMQVLQSSLTNPASLWGMTRGAMSGRAPFEAQIAQSKAALNRTKRNFEQQYGLELPEPAGQARAPMPGTGAAQRPKDIPEAEWNAMTPAERGLFK